MAKITSEISKYCEIHVKITASEHGYEASIVKI